MDIELRKKLLKEQIIILNAARDVLNESYLRSKPIIGKAQSSLLSSEKESLEALTARFARLCDFLFQRVFRTIDQIELADDGTGIDRLNRMEKRGVILSADEWRKLRELRNQIAHEYLIDSSDYVVQESFKSTPYLVDTVERLIKYSNKI